MSLPSGTYIIRNGDKNVGRRLAEDKSLLPKQVVLLPDGQDSTWEIENIGNDGYLLKNRNSPTANINDQVAALLIDQESAEKWHLEAVPQHGENRYIITTQDQSKGWVAPEESNEQVKKLARQYSSVSSQSSAFTDQVPAIDFYEILPSPVPSD